MTKLIVTFLVLIMWVAPAQAQSGVYQMNAFQGTVAAPGVGATLFWEANRINVSEGVYVWGNLDWQIKMHADNGHPVVLLITLSRSGYYGSDIGVNDSPAWWGPSRRVPYLDKQIVMPAYDDQGWLDNCQKFVQALGVRYNNDPRVTAVTVSMGWDGETHAVPSGFDSYVTAALGSGFKRAFEAYAKSSLFWFDTAFPTMPLFCANNPGDTGFRKELLRSYLIPMNIGIKNAGLTVGNKTDYSTSTYETSGGNYGIFSPMRDTKGKIQRCIESQTGVSTRESVAWAIWYAMQFEPTFIDLHKEWFAMNPEVIAWAQDKFERPGATAWIVFRDDESGAYFPDIPLSSNLYLSGWPGDFSVGIMRSTAVAAPRVWRAALPEPCWNQIESRQARQITTMTCRVTQPAALGESIIVRLSYMNKASAIDIVIDGKTWRVGGSATNRFESAEFATTVSKGWDGTVILYGPGIVHMLEVARDEDPTPIPTVTPRPTAIPTKTYTLLPTSTVTPTATWTPTPPPTVTSTSTDTPTATATETETPTPTATETQTPTPTETATATPTETDVPKACWDYVSLSWQERWGIRDTAILRLYQVEDRLDWQNDATLVWGLEENLGMPAGPVFEYTGDSGEAFQCRAFALGIIVVDGAHEPTICKCWAVVLPNGEQR